MKRLSYCVLLLTMGAASRAAAAEQDFRAGQVIMPGGIVSLDYRLAARPTPTVRLRPYDPLPSAGIEEYRLPRGRHFSPPSTISAPVTLRHARLAFAPRDMPEETLRAIRPTTRTGEYTTLASHDLMLRTNTRLSLGWRATRVTSHDSTIIADGGTAYRRTAKDLFQPSITFRSLLTNGLVVEFHHDERLRANMDSIFFGPRPMTLPEWRSRDRHADFQHSLSNEARLSWRGADGFELSGHIRDTGYRNQMIADERGLLRPISGASRSRDYGLAARWRPAAHMRLSASAVTEAMRFDPTLHRHKQRQTFTLGLEQEGPLGLIHLRILRQDIARFDTAHPDWRPEWGVETMMEGPLPTPHGIADMRFRLQARSIAESSPREAGLLASRNLQPQLRLDLLARW